MVALKGKPDIGDQINKRIIEPLANANKLSNMPDFNEDSKLGSGKEMVDRLTNLIAIFENKSLDFSKNRAEGDDILGDAYEYLMRHFATESGKSKGQFYTPAEVSRIMAQIIGIRTAKTTASTTVYDPTCGSGSLLLKVADEAQSKVTIYGQEKDSATSGLARMNMILHNNAEALIQHKEIRYADPAISKNRASSRRSISSSPIPLSATSGCRYRASSKRRGQQHGNRATCSRLRTIRGLWRAARKAGRLRLFAAHRPFPQEHGQRRLHPPPRRPYSGAMPRPDIRRNLIRKVYTSRASSAYHPTCFTALAFLLASS